MNNIPKIAVLGCGYWGKNLVRNFHQLGALGLVCDPGASGRSMAADIAPGLEVVPDIETAFRRADISGVAIATPAESHHRVSIQAMAAGKDVFVEKPLALDHCEGLDMKAKAEATGCVLMVGHLLEYHPGVLKLREMVTEGILGRVNYIYSHRLNFGKVRTEENALWSFAPHDIAVMLRLVGEMPLEVTCVGGNYITPNLADVTMSCLRFRSGLRGHIFVSWLNPFKEQKLVVVGDKKMAVFNDVSASDKLMLYNQRVEIRDRVPFLHNGDAVPVEIDVAEPLRNECQHFLDCVRERKQPLTDGQRGVDVLKVLEACQLSLEKGGDPIYLSDSARRFTPGIAVERATEGAGLVHQ